MNTSRRIAGVESRTPSACQASASGSAPAPTLPLVLILTLAMAPGQLQASASRRRHILYPRAARQDSHQSNPFSYQRDTPLLPQGAERAGRAYGGREGGSVNPLATERLSPLLRLRTSKACLFQLWCRGLLFCFTLVLHFLGSPAARSPLSLSLLICPFLSQVVIVPGYGLAVAGAQYAIAETVKLLTQHGVKVWYS